MKKILFGTLVLVLILSAVAPTASASTGTAEAFKSAVQSMGALAQDKEDTIIKETMNMIKSLKLDSSHIFYMNYDESQNHFLLMYVCPLKEKEIKPAVVQSFWMVYDMLNAVVSQHGDYDALFSILSYNDEYTYLVMPVQHDVMIINIKNNDIIDMRLNVI